MFPLTFNPLIIDDLSMYLVYTESSNRSSMRIEAREGTTDKLYYVVVHRLNIFK